MKQSKLATTSRFIGLAAALGLAACGERAWTPTAGQPADAAVAQTGQRADPAKKAFEDTTPKTGAQLGGTAPAALSDSAITAAVKAELAKDALLSAAKIDVDTANGKVALKGSAPDAAARDRATQLAMAVVGVVGVDNQITVGTS